MPRVTIHIRNEDWDKWQRIADKPKWLHAAINVETLGSELFPDGKFKIVSTKTKDEPHYEEMEETA